MRHERHDWIDCFDGASATTLDFDAVGVQNVQDFQDAAHVRLAGQVKQLKSEHTRMLREMQFIFKDGYLLTHVFLYVCPVLLII